MQTDLLRKYIPTISPVYRITKAQLMIGKRMDETIGSQKPEFHTSKSEAWCPCTVISYQLLVIVSAFKMKGFILCFIQ